MNVARCFVRLMPWFKGGENTNMIQYFLIDDVVEDCSDEVKGQAERVCRSCSPYLWTMCFGLSSVAETSPILCSYVIEGQKSVIKFGEYWYCVGLCSCQRWNMMFTLTSFPPTPCTIYTVFVILYDPFLDNGSSRTRPVVIAPYRVLLWSCR